MYWIFRIETKGGTGVPAGRFRLHQTPPGWGQASRLSDSDLNRSAGWGPASLPVDSRSEQIRWLASRWSQTHSRRRILMDTVRATPHPGPLPEGEGEDSSTIIHRGDTNVIGSEGACPERSRREGSGRSVCKPRPGMYRTGIIQSGMTSEVARSEVSFPSPADSPGIGAGIHNIRVPMSGFRTLKCPLSSGDLGT